MRGHCSSQVYSTIVERSVQLSGYSTVRGHCSSHVYSTVRGQVYSIVRGHCRSQMYSTVRGQYSCQVTVP